MIKESPTQPWRVRYVNGCPQGEEPQLSHLGVLGIFPRPGADSVLHASVLTEANTGAQGEPEKADLRKWQRILP